MPAVPAQALAERRDVSKPCSICGSTEHAWFSHPNDRVPLVDWSAVSRDFPPEEAYQRPVVIGIGIVGFIFGLVLGLVWAGC